MQDPLVPIMNITSVERETGFSKDVLRKWETRYGFPSPARDGAGERMYSPEQVNRLCLIKRLLDAGMRPSNVVKLDAAALITLAQARQSARSSGERVEPTISLDMLRNHNSDGLRQRLYQLMLSQGLERFVLGTLMPLNTAVGEAWACGELDIHEEHFYTETIQSLLREAITNLSYAQDRPRILLTTLPEEQHGLGLLMAAALFSLHGAHCISLGTQTPVHEIALAAQAHHVDLIVLSFSIVYPPRRIPTALNELRTRIGGGIEIWAGGLGVTRINESNVHDTLLLPTFELALEALSAWLASRQKSLKV